MKSIYGSANTGTTISLIGNLITGVEVNKSFRGRGYAERWLTVVCADADIERETLYLTLDPQEPEVSIERLRSFYERHGFEVMDEDPDARAMRRLPQERSQYAGSKTA